MSYCISIAQWNNRLQIVFIELIQDMKKYTWYTGACE